MSIEKLRLEFKNRNIIPHYKFNYSLNKWLIELNSFKSWLDTQTERTIITNNDFNQFIIKQHRIFFDKNEN
jgi:hypothetical protein